jgi:sulfur relay (sulfurtransferase) DsrC/TusE family protein
METPDKLACALEEVLFRRALEHKLEGYTLETSQELAAKVRAYDAGLAGREAAAHEHFWRTVERNGKWVTECETCPAIRVEAGAQPATGKNPEIFAVEHADGEWIDSQGNGGFSVFTHISEAQDEIDNTDDPENWKIVRYLRASASATPTEPTLKCYVCGARTSRSDL